MYAMLGIRPDITYVVSLCSRFMANLIEAYVTTTKQILRYLKGSIHRSLRYKGELELLFGFTDSDWAGDKATRRSTVGYVFSVGNAITSWQLKR